MENFLSKKKNNQPHCLLNQYLFHHEGQGMAYIRRSIGGVPEQ